MSQIATLVDGYVAAWNEHDPQKRRALVAGTFSGDATYVDPVLAGEGIDGISTMIGAAQQQFPRHRLTLVGEPDGHHDVLRFSWRFAAPDGTGSLDGLDCVVLGDDGLMRNVVGFLENAAA